MENNQSHDPISLTLKRKDTQKPEIQKEINVNLYYLSYDLDSGLVIAESSPFERKTEINPVGHLIKFFNSIEEALRVRDIIRRYPWRAKKLLNLI